MTQKTLKKLTLTEVAKKLKKLPGWGVQAKTTLIRKTFPQRSFIGGLVFIAKIAVHAELMNHHPDIELSYSAVTVSLTTHDVKGLTRLDFELAEKIEQIATA